jgi:hypothetical protein
MQSYDIVYKKMYVLLQTTGAEYATIEEMKKPDHVSETKPQHHLLSLVYLKDKSFQPKANKDIVLYTFTFKK